MAIETFGVTAAMIVDELPTNTRGITADSEGINTTKITAWIERAAGQINALLERAQIDIATAAEAGSPAREVARTAIIGYACAKALEIGSSNPADPRITRSWEQWREAYKQLKDYPSTIGDAQLPEAQVKSNYTPGSHVASDYTFRNTKW